MKKSGPRFSQVVHHVGLTNVTLLAQQYATLSEIIISAKVDELKHHLLRACASVHEAQIHPVLFSGGSPFREAFDEMQPSLIQSSRRIP